MLSNQEAFDKVVTHLVQQGKRAVGPAEVESMSPVCLYRAPDGSKCAAGALIPDEVYEPSMEGHGIDTVVRSSPDLQSLFKQTDLDLIRRLQAFHDTSSNWMRPFTFRRRLLGIAEDYHLSTKVLDEADLSKIGTVQ